MLRAWFFAAFALVTMRTASSVATTHQSAVWTPAFRTAPPPLTVVFHDVQIDHFAGTVAVGSPPQSVSLLASIVVSDLLVLNHKVEPRAFYDHTQSTTYRANGTRVELFVDATDALTGFASSDCVTLTGTHGSAADATAGQIVVDDQLFMELDGPDEIIRQLPPNVGGVIGLGPHRADSTGAPSIVQTMASRLEIDRPMVGLRFDDAAMHATFGGVDTAYCDEQDVIYFTQDASTDGPWWTVPLAGVDVNGTRVVGTSGHALVMDFFDGIVGPDDEIDKLADEVGTDSLNRLPCDGDGPDIELHLGDTDAGAVVVTLTKKMYTLPPVDKGICFFAFQGYTLGPIEPPTTAKPWVFGLGLLRNVYTVLYMGEAEGHQQRMGFAPLKHAGI